MRTNLIGFTGYAGSGKGTAAEALIRDRGFKEINFADPLREAMSRLNPYVNPWSGLRYNEVIKDLGYTEAKKQYPEIRILLQKFGTEIGREMFGENFWIDYTRNRLSASLFVGGGVVVTDVRFPNEVKLVCELGGKVYRIERPGYDAVNNHISDTGIQFLPNDGVILNDGTAESLHRKVKALYDSLNTTGEVPEDLLAGEQKDLWAV